MISGSIPLRENSSDGTAFGEFLRRAREQRGLTLQQISHETKIPWRHLDALEHGRLDAVPGGTYRRGEIRAYAEVVGLDKAMALEQLDRALQSSASIAAPAAAPSPRTYQPQWLIALAFGTAGAILLALLWNRPSAVAPARTTQADLLTSSPTVAVAAASQVLSAQPASPDTAAEIVSPPSPVLPAQEAVVALANQPPASAPAPVVDGLHITSDPPGARVTVDGIAWGVTPLRIEHLSPGERRVRVTKEGFSAAEQVVRLSGDRASSSLHLVLRGPAQ